MKQENNQQQRVRNFINQEEFYILIDDQVQQWLQNPSNHYKIEKAKNEKWFGSLHCNRDHKGLLGYLRINFGKQIKILKNLDNNLPIYDQRFHDFFGGDWFANEVKRNGFVSSEFILNKHLELLTTTN